MLWFAFRFSIFDRLTTAGTIRSIVTPVLWFAFRFSIFDRLTTAYLYFLFANPSCDLLSDSVSLTDWQQLRVGRCSTGLCCDLLSDSVSLTDWQQQSYTAGIAATRCDLLSDSVSLTDWQQHRCDRGDGHGRLWFAFRFSIFDRLTTALLIATNAPTRCDLLSDSVSLTDWQQPAWSQALSAHRCDLLSDSVSLTDWQQPLFIDRRTVSRCDLLSDSVSLTDWQQLIFDKLLVDNELKVLFKNRNPAF